MQILLGNVGSVRGRNFQCCDKVGRQVKQQAQMKSKSGNVMKDIKYSVALADQTRFIVRLLIRA